MANTPVNITGATTTVGYLVTPPFNSTDVYTFSFPYLNQNDFEIEVQSNTILESDDFEFTSDYLIQLTAAGVTKLNTLYGSLTSVAVVIRRRTQVDQRLVDYIDNSTLTEADLDLQADQLFYLIQEIYDSTEIGGVFFNPVDNSVDLDGQIINDIGEPILGNSAATLNTVLNNVVTPEYTEGADYRSGRMVFSSGDLYRANKAVPSAPATLATADFDLVIDASELAKISTLESGIATNVVDIATNVSDIATNASGIATNASGIATNVSDISTNASGIATNVSGIATNVSNIATNVSDIATNTADIATNVLGIATNASDLSGHELENELAHTERDTKANLETWVATANDGAVAYATDERKYYYARLGALQDLGGSGGGISTFQASFSYAEGELIIESSKIYEATVAFTSGATFDSSDWTLVSGAAFNVYASSATQDISITGAWSANATYTAKGYRSGEYLHVEAAVKLTGTPTGTFTLVFNDHIIDETKVTYANTNQEGTIFGLATVFDSGVGSYDGAVKYTNSTTVRILGDDGNSLWTPTSPITFSSGDAINLNFKVPILGWKDKEDNVVVAGTDNVLLTVEGEGSTGGAITTANNIDFTEVVDNKNVWSGTTLTAPRDGTYYLSGMVTFTTSGARGVKAVINSGAYEKALAGVITDFSHKFEGSIKLNAGDIVQIRLDSGSGTLSTSTKYHYINIQEFPSEDLIYAYLDESLVQVTGQGNGGTAITPNVTPIDFTEFSDTNGLWDGSTFTPDFNGRVSLQGMVIYTTSATHGFRLFIDTGSGYSGSRVISNAINSDIHHFSVTLEVVAGYSYQIRDFVAGATLSNDSNFHYLEILRIR